MFIRKHFGIFCLVVRLSCMVLCTGPLLLAGDACLAPIFADHMVLQRDQPIDVWGSAAPASTITVAMAGQTITTTTDPSGTWIATLPRQQASGPHILSITGGGIARTVSDVMIGDVWLASGQSNMVFGLGSTSAWTSVRTRGIFPAIRISKLPGSHAMEPAEGYSRAITWEQLDSARANAFSGVAYHFACTVQPALHIPLGVIEGACGGTMAEQWTPAGALQIADPQATSRTYADRAKVMAKLAADPTAKIGPMEAGAAALYNGTIHPLRRLKFAGVLWYQGEANSRSRDDYRPRLSTLVSSWRAVFVQPALPWIIVQLPGFGLPTDDGWMRVQEAQRLVAGELGLPLVVTIDQGSATTIHPANKEVVGRRAGLAALQHVYHQAVDGSAPRPTAMRRADGAIILEFDEDLVVHGDTIAGFTLAGPDNAFVPATATLDGRRVSITAPGLTAPTAVRYLWTQCPAVITLVDRAGIPVGPFRFGGDAPQTAP
jgi:sialate O-acetylesterase